MKVRANIKVTSKLNIDKLFYNEFIFDLDEMIAFIFGDIYVIYKNADSTLYQTTNPLNQYSSTGFGICFAAGYNYQDISM